MAAPLGSPAFGRAIAAIDGLGDREIRATTEIVRGLDNQPSLAVRRLVSDDSQLSRSLRWLRETAERLRDELNARSAESARDVARDLERAQERIDEAVGALNDALETLQLANATIAQQERALWTELQALREYAFLAGRLDDLVDDRIEALATTDPDRAGALRTEALFSVRRRRRDLLLQLAVVTQGYAALRLIEQDDLEVIWAIRTATTTTATAMRTALLAVQAMADRRRSVEVDLAGLGQAWNDVVVALDAVDVRKRRTFEDAGSPD